MVAPPCYLAPASTNAHMDDLEISHASGSILKTIVTSKSRQTTSFIDNAIEAGILLDILPSDLERHPRLHHYISDLLQWNLGLE